MELPELSVADRVSLERIRTRYFYQLDEGMLLEEGVKMTMSPLLDIASFCDPPFRTKFEPPVVASIYGSRLVDSSDRFYFI